MHQNNYVCMDEQKITQRKFNVHAQAEYSRNYSHLLIFFLLLHIFHYITLDHHISVSTATQALNFYKIYMYHRRNYGKRGRTHGGIIISFVCTVEGTEKKGSFMKLFKSILMQEKFHS